MCATSMLTRQFVAACWVALRADPQRHVISTFSHRCILGEPFCHHADRAGTATLKVPMPHFRGLVLALPDWQAMATG
jgi:extradiol dioxygenase family protein